MKNTNFAKKSLSAILAFAMLLGILAMLPITVGAADASGAGVGTKEDPIQIGTAEELLALPTRLASAQKTGGVSYVEITANIAIDNQSMSPIAISAYPVFIEGNNHEISNFTIKSASSYAGLFDHFAANSTVQNLHIVNGHVAVSVGNVGLLAGAAATGFSMINCSTDAQSSVTEGYNHTGGLVGNFYDQEGLGDYFVDKCVNNADVTSGKQVGGIVGNVYAQYAHVVIEGCKNYGTIAATNVAGGILGQAEASLSITIKECENRATVSATTAAAGILGKIASAVKESYSFSYNLNTGNVTAGTYAAGILAYSNGKTLFDPLTNCGNEGTITTTGESSTYTAGILAYANVTEKFGSRHWISGCYSMGTLVAATEAYSGGILGYFAAPEGSMITLSECYDDTARNIEYPDESDHGLLAGSIVGCTAQLYFSRCYAVKKEYLDILSKTTITEPEHSAAVDTNTSTVYTDYDGTVPSPFNVQMAKRRENVLIRKPDGLGTPEAPFMIGTKYEMLWFIGAHSSLDSMTYIELTGDIDLDDRFVSLDMSNGQYYEPRSIHLDGHNHTLSGYTTNRGFFSRLGPKSTIKNLRVTDVTASGNTGDNYIVGALGGQVYYGLTMINVSLDNATVTQPKNNVAGGIIGSIETEGGIDSFIIDCSSSATVNGTGVAGGIIGKAWSRYADITIMNCTNTGKITSAGTGSTKSVGGILGWADTMNNLAIYNCTNTGAIGSADVDAYAGGILGQISTNVSYATTVKSCRNEGSVSSSTYAGGIVAYTANANATSIDACANVATITGTTAAGAIFAGTASNATVTISNSYNTAAGDITPATTKVTTTNCYSGASVPADIQSAADMRLTIAPSAQNLWVRIKITDNFGLMAITNVTDGKKLSDYQEVGFYFLESDTTPLPSDVIKAANKVEGAAYNGSETKFAAAYQDMLAVNFDRNLHFMAYAIDQYGNEVYSDMRTLNVESLIEQLAEGYNGLVKNPYEKALYQQMLNYGEAYDKFEGFDLKLGNLNIAQEAFDKTNPAGGYNTASEEQTLANLDRYANIMNDLGLDIMGMNEVDLFRSERGVHVPYEVAKRMEQLNPGQEYYWAFASALDSSATFANGNKVRYFANSYTGAEQPDGLFQSGDGGYRASDTMAYYGEAIISKYPIVSYEAKYILPDLNEALAVPTLEDYDNATEYEQALAAYNKAIAGTSMDCQYCNGYERRVILVVQLNVNGEIVTVMVSHFDHTGNEATLAASVEAVKEVLADPQYANTPCFLMGDLNIGRQSSYTKQLDDTVLERAGMGDMTKTFEGGSKIDHIFYGKYTEILEYKSVTNNYSSDHFPVTAVARIKRADFR